VDARDKRGHDGGWRSDHGKPANNLSRIRRIRWQRYRGTDGSRPRRKTMRFSKSARHSSVRGSIFDTACITDNKKRETRKLIIRNE
jgi:hypothetical protein